MIGLASLRKMPILTLTILWTLVCTCRAQWILSQMQSTSSSLDLIQWSLFLCLPTPQILQTAAHLSPIRSKMLTGHQTFMLLSIMVRLSTVDWLHYKSASIQVTCISHLKTGTSLLQHLSTSEWLMFAIMVLCKLIHLTQWSLRSTWALQLYKTLKYGPTNKSTWAMALPSVAQRH